MHSHWTDMEPLLDSSGWGCGGKEKICRFCGCDNTENVDIFSANKADDYHHMNMDQENLLYKISTVYPFLVRWQRNINPIVWYLIGYVSLCLSFMNFQMYENDPLPQHICPECIDIVSSLYRDIQQVLKHQKNLMNLIKVEQPNHEYFRILNSIEVN